MRCAGRVANEGTGIANVNEVAHHLGAFNKPNARAEVTFDPESEQAGGARHLPLKQGVLWMPAQARVVDPSHPRIILKKRGEREGVFIVLCHAQWQRFNALQNLPSTGGTERGTKYA